MTTVSLRRATLVSMTVLLTLVGAAAMLLAYKLASVTKLLIFLTDSYARLHSTPVWVFPMLTRRRPAIRIRKIRLR